MESLATLELSSIICSSVVSTSTSCSTSCSIWRTICWRDSRFAESVLELREALSGCVCSAERRPLSSCCLKATEWLIARSCCLPRSKSRISECGRRNCWVIQNIGGLPVDSNTLWRILVLQPARSIHSSNGISSKKKRSCFGCHWTYCWTSGKFGSGRVLWWVNLRLVLGEYPLTLMMLPLQ